VTARSASSVGLGAVLVSPTSASELRFTVSNLFCSLGISSTGMSFYISGGLRF